MPRLRTRNIIIIAVGAAALIGGFFLLRRRRPTTAEAIEVAKTWDQLTVNPQSMQGKAGVPKDEILARMMDKVRADAGWMEKVRSQMAEADLTEEEAVRINAIFWLTKTKVLI